MMKSKSMFPLIPLLNFYNKKNKKNLQTWIIQIINSRKILSIMIMDWIYLKMIYLILHKRLVRKRWLWCLVMIFLTWISRAYNWQNKTQVKGKEEKWSSQYSQLALMMLRVTLPLKKNKRLIGIMHIKDMTLRSIHGLAEILWRIIFVSYSAQLIRSCGITMDGRE